MYIIRDRECGNAIEAFNTLEEATNTLLGYEEVDILEGTYVENFYEIIESEG